MKKVVDPKTKLFMEFFEREMGVKFVDAETGERITTGSSDHPDK